MDISLNLTCAKNSPYGCIQSFSLLGIFFSSVEVEQGYPIGANNGWGWRSIQN